MLLLLIIPLFSICCLFIINFSGETEAGIFTRIRVSLLKTSLKTGLFIILSTELLSYGDHINRFSIIIAWVVFGIIVFGICRRRHISFFVLKDIFSSLKNFIKEKPVILLIPALLLISGLIAIFYPPNNYDSLTYHMARVGHWINNGSVKHYPTHIIRQLVYPPFAEWIILHINLISGTDRLANFVQTIFFGGCILQVSLIVKSFGGNTRAQLYGCLFTAFIPMAIIQSNTTQNDIVVAYFVLAFVYFTIEIFKFYSRQNVILAGLSLGLALLTKGTAYLYCILFCGWYILILVALYRHPVKYIFFRAVSLSLVPLIAIGLNSGHYSRNYGLNGSMLGNASSGVSNEGHNIRAIAFVAIKNLMNHLPVTSDFKQSVSNFGLRHGVDVNDPKYSFSPINAMMEHLSYHEDFAQNYLHTLLIIACVIAFFFRGSLYKKRMNVYTLYVFTCIGITILFCILFKWQPWSNRLETTLFILFCPVLALTVSSLPTFLRTLLLLPFIYFAWNALTLSARHPVFPVEESILKKPYASFIYYDGLLGCSKYVDTCTATEFGIYVGADSPDYVYYKMLAESEHGIRPMKHMFIDNESKKYEKPFLPEVIISLEAGRESYTVRNHVYLKERVFPDGPAIFRLQH